MDSIAFEFCDAVVGTIKYLPWMKVPISDEKWNKALQDHSANRKRFQLCLGYYDDDDKWSYYLYNTEFGSSIPFATLLKRVGSKYLRIDYIKMLAGRSLIETSKEELHVLLNRLQCMQPFFNFPSLLLNDVASKVPESDLDQLLSSFAKINISAFYSCSNGRSAIEFAKQLMQQDTLVNVIVIQRERGMLSAAVADYRATRRVLHYVTQKVEVYVTTLWFVR